MSLLILIKNVYVFSLVSFQAACLRAFPTGRSPACARSVGPSAGPASGDRKTGGDNGMWHDGIPPLPRGEGGPSS